MSPSPKPRIEIIVQPAQKSSRFRYERERRSTGNILGENSTTENRTYPTIQLTGYDINADEDVVIVVSCVTVNYPYLVHPHKLVGNNCNDGVFSKTLDRGSKREVFSNLGIHCVKKTDMETALKQREAMKIDPYNGGFKHKNNPKSIDIHCVRLCFQAFVKKKNTGSSSFLAQALSSPIYDKNSSTSSELKIVKLSHSSGPAKGGLEMLLFCEKISSKDDIRIRFYEENQGQIVWEEFAKKLLVHKQNSIAFETPAYRNQKIRDEVMVYVQLLRLSDNATSEPKEFHYTRSPPSSSHQIPISHPPPESPARNDQNQNPSTSSSRDFDQWLRTSPSTVYPNGMVLSLSSANSMQMSETELFPIIPVPEPIPSTTTGFELEPEPTYSQQTTSQWTLHPNPVYSSPVTQEQQYQEQPDSIFNFSTTNSSPVESLETYYRMTTTDETNTTTFAKDSSISSVLPIYTNLQPATSTQPLDTSETVEMNFNFHEIGLMRYVFEKKVDKISDDEPNNVDTINAVEHLSDNLRNMSIGSDGIPISRSRFFSNFGGFFSSLLKNLTKKH